MGYLIFQIEDKVRIKADRKVGALGALKQLAYHGGPFAWVNMQGLTTAESLEEALLAWHRLPENENDDNKPDIVALFFEGEKYGNDDELFRALAPYIEPGFYIAMHGEGDGLIWRWYFDGQDVRKQRGSICWDSDSSLPLEHPGRWYKE